MAVKYLGVQDSHPTPPAAGTYHLYILSTDDDYYLQDDSGQTNLVDNVAKHGIDSTTYHNGVSGATEDNLISFDSNGLPQDSGISEDDATGLPKNYVYGLQISRSSAYQIQISPGVARDDTDTVDIELISGALTADITSSGANGLDTGSESSATWYFVYIITGTSGTAALLSTSATSPTMPSGYTKKRRLGSVRNNDSSNFYNFYQVGDSRLRWFWYDEDRDAGEFRVLNAGTAGSFTDVDCGDVIPSTAAHIICMTHGYQLFSGAGFVEVRPDGYSNSPSGTVFVSDMQGTNQAIFENVGEILEYRRLSGASAYIDITGYMEEI